MIPECLSLDIYQDRWAFIAVALVQTKQLRPKNFPAWAGTDFFLSGYRIFVRYKTSEGKNLRGLYILKSETDSLKMQLLGNLLTNYNYSKTDISFSRSGSGFSIHSQKSGLEIAADIGEPGSPLPPGSPFPNWKEARKYAGPLPFTFSYNKEKKEVLIIEGVRENWIPKPLLVSSCSIGFIETLGIKDPVLANAFLLENIPYHWKKGKRDLWRQ
jgi:hypothetical protein